jgi:hypothetical protein
LVVVSFLVVNSFDVTVASSTQNANSSVQNANRSTNRNQNESRSISGGDQPDFSHNTWELPEDADKTKNPVTASAESIE